jgi:hypothetical protein
LNKFTGLSKTLDLPEDTRVTDVFVSGDRLAVCVTKGSQLIVFNGQIGKWSRFRLAVCDPSPNGYPVVGNNVVCYPRKGYVVAYSATKDTWGTLARNGTPVVGDYAIKVATETENYEFTAQSGSWTSTGGSDGTRR